MLSKINMTIWNMNIYKNIQTIKCVHLEAKIGK